MPLRESWPSQSERQTDIYVSPPSSFTPSQPFHQSFSPPHLIIIIFYSPPFLPSSAFFSSSPPVKKKNLLHLQIEHIGSEDEFITTSSGFAFPYVSCFAPKPLHIHVFVHFHVVRAKPQKLIFLSPFHSQCVFMQLCSRNSFGASVAFP